VSETHAIPSVCEHLRPVAEYLVNRGAKVTYAGPAWSRNCRVWLYFDIVLDCEGLVKQFALPATITIHDHRGTHDGAERGLVCAECHDAVMGIHPAYAPAD
jgi:hypothetical protein